MERMEKLGARKRKSIRNGKDGKNWELVRGKVNGMERMEKLGARKRKSKRNAKYGKTES